jgi:hypothetical protein
MRGLQKTHHWMQNRAFRPQYRSYPIQSIKTHPHGQIQKEVADWMSGSRDRSSLNRGRGSYPLTVVSLTLKLRSTILTTKSPAAWLQD